MIKFLLLLFHTIMTMAYVYESSTKKGKAYAIVSIILAIFEIITIAYIK